MEAIIIHPKSKEEASLFEQLAKALKVPFEKAKPAKLTEREKAVKKYGKKFVEKIEASEKNFAKGEYTTIKKIEDVIQVHSLRGHYPQ